MSRPTLLSVSDTKLLFSSCSQRPDRETAANSLFDGIPIVLVDESHHCILQSILHKHLKVLSLEVLLDQTGHSKLRQPLADGRGRRVVVLEPLFLLLLGSVGVILDLCRCVQLLPTKEALSSLFSAGFFLR